MRVSKSSTDVVDDKNGDRKEANCGSVTSCFENLWLHCRVKKVGSASTSQENPERIIPKCVWTETDLPAFIVARSISTDKCSLDSSNETRKLSKGNAVTQRFLFAHEKLLQKLGSTTPVVMGVSEDGNNNEATYSISKPCRHYSEMCLRRYKSCSSSIDKGRTGSLPPLLWVLLSCVMLPWLPCMTCTNQQSYFQLHVLDSSR